MSLPEWIVKTEHEKEPENRDHNQEVIAQAIKDLVQELRKLKIFKPSFLDACAIFATNPFLQEEISFKILNSKNIKNYKYDERLETFTNNLSRAIQFNSYNSQPEELNWFERQLRKRRM